MTTPTMITRALGRSGPAVSAIGLGCMGLSQGYGDADDRESVATLRRAVELGVTFFDTAMSYGSGHNERLVGEALAPYRDEVVLATKLGIVRDPAGAVSLDGRPEHVRAHCEASLTRIGTDRIDLYYLHRVDPDVPVEETIGAMAQLVAEGKVGHLGISEADAPTLARAAATHPIAVLQCEWSLWWREPEDDVVPAARRLGIGLVPYSPLGRGFLAGSVQPGEFGVGRLPSRRPALRRRAPGEQHRGRRAAGPHRRTPRRHMRAARVGLAARPGRGRRADPGHAPREPRRAERRGGRPRPGRAGPRRDRGRRRPRHVVWGPPVLRRAPHAAEPHVSTGGYLARPRGDGPFKGVVVGMELFGVTAHVRAVCDRIAGLGLLAYAPDLYHREAPGTELPEDAEGRERGFALLHRLTRDQAIADVRAAVAYLRVRGATEVGMVGLSVGGHVAYLAATAMELSAVAVVYGGWLPTSDIPLGRPEPTLARTPAITAPVLLLVGEDDHVVPYEHRRATAEALAAAGVPHEIVLYPGVGHGFLNEDRETHDPEAAEDAWRRIGRLFTLPQCPPAS